MIILPPPHSHLFISLKLLLLIQMSRRILTKNWPCPIGPSPTCPGYPLLSCGPFSYSCPPPPCQKDDQCSPLRCKKVEGICEDYPEPKMPGTKCSQHSQCGMEMLCLNGECTEGKKAGRSGSYRSCIKSIECPPMEDCEQGVCLIRLGPKQKSEEKEIGGLQRENGLNYWSTGWCSPLGHCQNDGDEECLPIGKRDQCFPRQFFNQIGQPIPPPPGHPLCRDANSIAGHPSEHCQQRQWLCGDALYWQLMEEQCPRSCGKCEDRAHVDLLLSMGRVKIKGWIKIMEKRGNEGGGGDKAGQEPLAKGGETLRSWKRKKKVKVIKEGRRKMKEEEEEEEEEEDEENNYGFGKGGEGVEGSRCLDHWNSADCARLAHLCTNGAYRKGLARLCPRTCKHC